MTQEQIFYLPGLQLTQTNDIQSIVYQVDYTKDAEASSSNLALQHSEVVTEATIDNVTVTCRMKCQKRTHKNR